MKNVEEKLDKINEKLDGVIRVQIEQAADIKHHIYRTDLSEEHIKLLESRISPIEKHVAQVSGIIKLFSGVAILAGIVKAVVEVLNYLQ